MSTTQVYYGDWGPDHPWRDETGLAAMMNDFEITDTDLEGVEILYANYEISGYEGSAFVLFRKDGKLWEVNANHCSCYGLEGQWGPERSNPKELRNRLSTESWFASENPFLSALLPRLEE